MIAHVGSVLTPPSKLHANPNLDDFGIHKDKAVPNVRPFRSIRHIEAVFIRISPPADQK